MKIISQTKKLILLFFTFTIFIFASSCNSRLKGHQIVGVWEHDGHYIEFSSDGYLKKGDQEYPISVNEEKITVDKQGEAVVLEYSINSNGTLTMNGLIYYPVTKK